MVAFVLCLVVGAALMVVGVLDRPPGVRIRYGWSFGYLENSTKRGKIVGFLGLAIFLVALLFLVPTLRR